MPLLNDEILGQNTDHPPSSPHVLPPKPVAISLYHPQELATDETVNHPFPRLL